MHDRNPARRSPFDGSGGGTPIFGGGSKGFGNADDDDSGDDAMRSSKIRTFGESLESGHHNEKWKRPTNKTGKGATHVRSFHCKLTGDSLANLDNQVNEWLDTHPDYEVKFVSTQVGMWTGKIKEPHMIVMLWL